MRYKIQLMKLRFIALLSLLVSSHLSCQEIFPGGVAGAEMWYYPVRNDIVIPNFNNQSTDFKYIGLQSCMQDWQIGLFNFNLSILSESLCLNYLAHLENTTSRNIFFVSQPKPAAEGENETNYSHVKASWNPQLNMPATKILYPKFDIANRGLAFDNRVINYEGDNGPNINFYHWNIAQIPNKYNSYGFKGESLFEIGKNFTNVTDQIQADSFAGNFAEYISFPFELNYNQRNRVESYLALKYGITLERKGDYRNSRNVVFFNYNNSLFWNRIFGIGKDRISGLNQLQSESSHYKNYLIASVGPLADNNDHKQQFISIDNDNFIVFGDNAAMDVLMDVNDFNVRPLKRKWLSQSTGESASTIPMNFKFNLHQAIKDAMTQNPTLKLWMLHDKYVNNQSQSDFNSQYVDYYEADNIDADYGYFEKIFFDTDENLFDQFTFGVGPEMIVQVRFDDDCDDNRIRSQIVITGSVGPYRITISNSDNYHEELSSTENQVNVELIAPDTYTVVVQDYYGNESEVTVDVELNQIAVDLGPDIVLTAVNPQATLDASLTITDPDAEYTWYYNGELLQHYDPILTATEPGVYKVKVIGGNQMCEDWDEIELSYNFNAIATYAAPCQEDAASLTLTLTGGISNYYVHVHNSDAPLTTDIFTVSSSGNISIEGVYYGNNVVTIQDGAGNQQILNINIISPVDGIELDLISQLNLNCIPNNGPEYPLYICPGAIIDGSLNVTNPNVSYEWFLNGESMGLYNPHVEVYTGASYETGSVLEYELVITNLSNGCTVSDKFGLMKNNYIQGVSPQQSSSLAGSVVQEEDSIPEASQPELYTTIYPNPVSHSTTFYYEITSNEIFSGTVEVFSQNGAIIHQETIQGNSAYKLPLMLLSSGSYVIRSTTSAGTVANQVIIK